MAGIHLCLTYMREAYQVVLILGGGERIDNFFEGHRVCPILRENLRSTPGAPSADITGPFIADSRTEGAPSAEIIGQKGPLQRR